MTRPHTRLVPPLSDPGLHAAFDARVDISAGSAGCHPWHGQIVRGEPRLKYKSVTYKAHRIAYELLNGSVAGVAVKRTCSTATCCNAAHLVRTVSLGSSAIWRPYFAICARCGVGYFPYWSTGKRRDTCADCGHRARTRARAKNPAKHIATRQAHRADIAARARDIWNAARKRAFAAGIPFDITLDDIVIPKTCPVLGIDLSLTNTRATKHSSPSLDRIEPLLGYVRGNVAIISNRANWLKNDGSAEEHERIAAWIRQARAP